jgi:hypothetical protein
MSKESFENIIVIEPLNTMSRLSAAQNTESLKQTFTTYQLLKVAGGSIEHRHTVCIT